MFTFRYRGNHVKADKSSGTCSLARMEAMRNANDFMFFILCIIYR